MGFWILSGGLLTTAPKLLPSHLTSWRQLSLSTCTIVYVALRIQWLSHYSSDPVNSDRQQFLLDNSGYLIIIRRMHVVFLDVFVPDLYSSFTSGTNMAPSSRRSTEIFVSLYTYKITWSRVFNSAQLLDVYCQINWHRSPFVPFWYLQTGKSPLKLQFWRCADPVITPIILKLQDAHWWPRISQTITLYFTFWRPECCTAWLHFSINFQFYWNNIWS